MGKVNLADPSQVTMAGVVPPNMAGTYTLRGVSASFGKSNSGNMQVTWNCEIVHPEILEKGGKKYALDTIKVTYYLGTQMFVDGVLDEEATKKKLGTLAGLHERLQLPMEIDPENPDISIYENLVFDAVLSSSQDKLQVQNEKTGKYELAKDSEGKEISRGFKLNARVEDILRRSSREVNRAF